MKITSFAYVMVILFSFTILLHGQTTPILTGQSTPIKLAEQYYELKDYAESAEWYRVHIGDYPDDKVSTAMLADCYIHLSEYQQATDCFESLFKTDQDINPEWYFSYAELLRNQSNVEKAKNYYQLYSKNNPELAQSYIQTCELILHPKPIEIPPVPMSEAVAVQEADVAIVVPLEVEKVTMNSELTSVKGVEVANLPEAPVLQAKAKKILQINKVYFVQITALSKFNQQVSERFRKFASYGDVYKVQVDGISKIRIGFYNNLNEALQTLSQLKKNGIVDAFVVMDILDENSMQILFKNSTEFTTNKTAFTEGAEEGKYKIRVTEFKSPDWFDAAKIEDLGKIEHWTKSGWTIIILGNFKELKAAKSKLNEVKNRGYKEAYVVIEEDGKLYRQN
ncbi:MAG: hypothetical protein M3Q56_02180 [Bacteroidota bacterium]|nr:hypothetical protein [Bacteroidota bacterium]